MERVEDGSCLGFEAMPLKQNSDLVEVGNLTLQVLKEGSGPAVVMIPSYGRDAGEDFDRFSELLAGAGFLVLRPQPRGIGESTGLADSVSALDQANDVAIVVERLAGGKAVLVGHAFGHFIARVVATSHPDRVRGVVLAASQSKHVPPLVGIAPFLAASPNLPEDERLAVLQGAFFAPGHNGRAWLQGWYPRTLAMQRESVRGIDVEKYWAGGNAPLLELIPESDAFKPYASWRELREQFPDRVTTSIISNAGHALFPEEPKQAADAVIAWCSGLS